MTALDAGSGGAKAGRQAARGGIWTLAERVISQLAQLAVFIVAARILGPAEFGIFALVSAIAIILLCFAELGWPAYIMNWAGDETVPRQVLTLSILSGVATGLLGLAATAAARLAGASGEITALCALFSVWLTMGPLAAATGGLMIRRGHLVRASLCEIAGELVALVVSIAALIAGHGLLALAYGRIAFIATRLGLNVLGTRAMPAGRLREAPLAAIRDFSLHVLATRLIIQLRGHAATFLVGGFLGPTAVGHYRAAERLTGAAAEIIGAPVQKIAWSYLREARDDPSGGIPSRLWSARAEHLFRAVKIVSVPVFVWLALMADDIVVGLLGPEWLPAALAASLIAIGRLLMLYGNATEPVLALAGAVGRLPGAMLVFLVSAVLLTLVSAPFGLVAVSAAQVALGAIVLAVTLRLFARHAHLRREETLSGTLPVLAATAASGAAAMALKTSGTGADWQPLLRALALGLAALPVYAAVLLALDAELRAGARRIARSLT